MSEEIRAAFVVVGLITLVTMLSAPFIKLMGWWFCLWEIGCK